MKPATVTLLGMLAAAAMATIHDGPAVAAEDCKALLKQAMENEKAATKAASYKDDEAAQHYWREYRISLSQYQACVDREEAAMKAAREKAAEAAREKAEAEAATEAGRAKADADEQAAGNLLGFEVLITLGQDSGLCPQCGMGHPPDDDSPASTPMPSPSPAPAHGGGGHTK